MTLSFHGPWQAWAYYLGGSTLAMIAIVLGALTIHATCEAFAAQRDEAGEDTDGLHFDSASNSTGVQDHG